MHSMVGGRRLELRVIALALVAFGVAGCSGDTTRFASDGGYQDWQPEAAGSTRAPSGRIEQQPLGPPQGYGGNQNGYGGNNSNGYSTNQNGGYPQSGSYYQTQSAAPATSGRGMVSYAP